MPEQRILATVRKNAREEIRISLQSIAIEIQRADDILEGRTDG